MAATAAAAVAAARGAAAAIAAVAAVPFGSRRPPDMEDVIRKGQERLKNLIPGGLGSLKGIVLIVLAAVVIWLVTGFFRVQPNQQAIQLVFGKPYGEPVEPGLHYNLPSPIGNVVVVNVQDQRRIVIGSRGGGPRRALRSRGPRPTSTENLMLTGDENIVDIEFAVLWQIKDVFKYAFDVRNGEENVRAAAEAAMREVIGKSNLQYAQTEGRTRIEQDTKDLLQKILDEYGLGVRITQVQLLRVDPPQEVIGAFRDVQAARADKEKSINEANTYRNQVLPRAKGEAESIIQRGEAYKAQTVARAKGDAQRFDQVYEQYAKAKDITTERLYLETMEDVLRNVNKVMVDKNASGTGVRALPAAARAEVEPAGGNALSASSALAGSRRRRAGSHAMSNRSIVALVGLAVLAFLLTQTFYTVDPTKQVLVRQFGAIVGEPKTEPGLYAKIPLVQDIERIDRRLLDYEAEEFEIIAGDQKRLVVDAYARYKIDAAKKFVETVPGGEPALRGLLDSLINSEIRGVLSSVPLHAVLTEQRASLMDDITRRVNAKTKDLGVEMVDVRIKRADLPQANSQSVYNRMKTDREREAGQLRAEGDEEKPAHHRNGRPRGRRHQGRCRAEGPDHHGRGRRRGDRVYAEAFNRDKDFYGFYRRMEAYKQAFSAGGSTMILSPDTDFFRYFNDPAGWWRPRSKPREQR